MQKFEHDTCIVFPDDLENTLKAKEKEGWELVDVCRSVVYREARYRLFFKREFGQPIDNAYSGSGRH